MPAEDREISGKIDTFEQNTERTILVGSGKGGGLNTYEQNLVTAAQVLGRWVIAAAILVFCGLVFVGLQIG